jgi:hypothetical protein
MAHKWTCWSSAWKGKEGRRKYLKWDGFDFVFLWLLALLDAVGVVRAFGQECVSQRERKPSATGRRISSGVVLRVTQCCLQQFIGIQTKMCTWHFEGLLRLESIREKVAVSVARPQDFVNKDIVAVDNVCGSSKCVVGSVLQAKWVGLPEWAQVLQQSQTVQGRQVTCEVHAWV